MVDKLNSEFGSEIKIEIKDRVVENGKNSANGKYESELKEGKYLNLLESYAINWPPEKVARDVLQNFFDGNGGTLEGVDVFVNKNEEGDGVVRIESASTYDYRKLTNIGGTSKSNDQNAIGGFGEGAKMAAFVMLKDMGMKKVTFGSNDWQLEFYFDELKEGEYDEPVKGLHAKLTKLETPINGNFFEFVVPRNNLKKQEYLEIFEGAEDLFRHPDNPDFQNPIYEDENFGMVFLGVKGNGNFYDGGQRRHVGEEKWNTIDGFNIWSRNPVFKKDRDRGKIDFVDFTYNFLKPMVSNIEGEKAVSLIYSLKDLWSTESTGFSYQVRHKVIEYLVDRVKRDNGQLDFPENCLADTDFTLPLSIKNVLKQDGYILCQGDLKKIGMKSTTERFLEMQSHYQKEPTKEQAEKISILKDLSKMVFLRSNKISISDLKPKEIWIYSRNDEKSIVNGQYDTNFVWLAEEVLKGSLPDVLSTYLHELCHKKGADESSEFSYALTDVQAVVIDLLLNPNDNEKQILEGMKSKWKILNSDKVQKSSIWDRFRKKKS